eukprot:945007-Pleurochrysis_carterae.AAC.1
MQLALSFFRSGSNAEPGSAASHWLLDAYRSIAALATEPHGRKCPLRATSGGHARRCQPTQHLGS